MLLSKGVDMGLNAYVTRLGAYVIGVVFHNHTWHKFYVCCIIILFFSFMFIMLSLPSLHTLDNFYLNHYYLVHIPLAMAWVFVSNKVKLGGGSYVLVPHDISSWFICHSKGMWGLVHSYDKWWENIFICLGAYVLTNARTIFSTPNWYHKDSCV